MICEIIAVGSELLLGNIANTDAQKLSQKLSELGMDVHYHSVVGDNRERLAAAVNLAKTRTDVIITTGGLGPTYDDLTREVVSATFGLPLDLHAPSIERMQKYFDKVRRTMTENNKKQAMLPRGATVLDNDWGTAPGCAFFSGGKHVIMLPGPPSECLPMFDAKVKPYLLALSDDTVVSRYVRIFGMGEAAAEDRLRDMMENAKNPSIAPYATTGEVMLRVTAKDKSQEAAFAMTVPVVEEILSRLPGVVYGVDVDSIEDKLCRTLKEKGLTISFAESCTGGLCTKRLTDIPGSSSVLLGGVCAYDNAVKVNLLNVPYEIILRRGAVSRSVALLMAQGAKNLFASDIAVGITGVAGPGGSENKPEGLVYVAVTMGGVSFCRELHLGSGREKIRHVAASHGLHMALKAAETVNTNPK